MAEHIPTRFGVLDKRLAEAVRHALDVAVTFPALALMNDVHLRLASMVGIVEADCAMPEPPSHQWRELMVNLFGQNSAGVRRSPVTCRAGRPNDLTLAHIAFGRSYELSNDERRTVHELLAAAGAFIVATSIAMSELVERLNIYGMDTFVTESLISTLHHTGLVGLQLAETADAGAWLHLLSDSGRGAPTIARPVVERVLQHASPRADRGGRIVLMVDPMDEDHRRALTERALETIRESMHRRGEPGIARQVVVVSTSNGWQSEPLPLPSHSSTMSWDSSACGAKSTDHLLSRVARNVDLLGQHDGRAGWRSAGGRARSALHGPGTVLLIVLINGSYGKRPKTRIELLPPSNFGEALRDTSVVFISVSPPAAKLNSLFKAWSAAGAREVHYQCLQSYTRDKAVTVPDPGGLTATNRHSSVDWRVFSRIARKGRSRLRRTTPPREV